MKDEIQKICKKYHYDKTRLLDIYWDIQKYFNYIPQNAVEILASELDISLSQLKDTLSFYHFFHQKPAGEIQIYVDTSAICELYGAHDVIKCFESHLNCKVGSTDPSGKFGLYTTSCIGMSDQAPAALIQNIPVGRLNPNKIKRIVSDLKNGILPLIQVTNTVQKKADVLLGTYTLGECINTLKTITPTEVIKTVTDSGIRGRGGAGFATGKKWALCSAQTEKTRYIVCNADEGEPGTFKDRYLLRYFPQLVFEGMIIAARSVGAQQGILYLRAEYSYLKGHLEKALAEMRQKQLLGKNILKIPDFDFDIRIQLGAGSYVVGEETALLESLEGKRGEPRVRPPFPVEQGYLGKPTIVNNVETLASVARIIKNGAQWYRKFGTELSPGTKLLSVSGDCEKPGIYEVEWGLSVGKLLELVKATNPMAIQIGGASGICLSAKDIDRKIAFEDIPTGGSVMIFNKKRDLLKIMKNFIEFFVAESCGCCVPCRAGNIVLNEQMEYILSGEAAKVDLQRIKHWAGIIGPSSRCGLGQTCINPILTSMQAFPKLYSEKVKEHEALFRPFDVKEKTSEYDNIVKAHQNRHGDIS
ncbi:MAG: NAD(P)H-dependent oxidoreductase subunit E [Bdellovibrionota bacterium]